MKLRRSFLSAIFLFSLIFALVLPAHAANKFWPATGLTGGTDALDGIDGALITAGDFAIVALDAGSTTPKVYFYRCYESSAAESSPSVISPDANAGTKRWHLSKIVSNGMDPAASTGVDISGSNGSITFLGQGDGADENLTIDLNTTGNTVIFSSGTSATAANWNQFIISANGFTPDAAGGAALGTGALPFSSVFIGDEATNNVQLINTAAASAVVLTLPSTTGTLARLEDKIADLAASTSAELAAKISDKQGTGVIVFSDSPTFVDDITIGAAGVKFTGANGSLTILGLGDGQDEDVKIDLNTTANTIIVSSPASSATKVSLSALNLATTGIITGAIGVTSSAGSYTLGTIPEEVNGYFILLTAAGTLTLPDMTIGQSFCVGSRDDNEVVTIDAHANDSITLCPTAATCVKGVAGATVVNTVAAADGAGNYICFLVVEADNIMEMGRRGTWVVP